MVKHLVKSCLKAVAPDWYSAFTAARADRICQQVMEQNGIPAIATALIDRYGLRVLDGPFAGMQYIQHSAGSSFVPKLLGSYEAELHPALAQILGTAYETVVDVGCAEGYYVVGLAMHLSGTPAIYAFDTNLQAQALCRELAQRNQVGDRITIQGACDPAQLQSVLQGRSLVICDCEGYEAELLQPDQIPALAQADILVELHDMFVPGLTPLLMERFGISHSVQLIDSTPRNPGDYPQVQFLEPQQQTNAVSEFRSSHQQWAFMQPKN